MTDQIIHKLEPTTSVRVGHVLCTGELFYDGAGQTSVEWAKVNCPACDAKALYIVQYGPSFHDVNWGNCWGCGKVTMLACQRIQGLHECHECHTHGSPQDRKAQALIARRFPRRRMVL